MMIGVLLDPPRRTVIGVLALLGVAVLMMMALATERPPQPVPASAPALEFSAERALGPLRQLAAEPRPLGSPASDQARDGLVDRLRSAGFAVQVARGVGATTAQGTASLGRVDNIVATRAGREPTGSVVLAAHYDSVAAGPGASDDGAAVAAMLETVRALDAGAPLRNDLVLLITDGEEDGLLGAAAFVRQPTSLRAPASVLNFEARGVSGPSVMFETSRDNAALVGIFAAAAPHPSGDSSLVEMYRLLPNDTDFTEFAGAGLGGMNFAYLQGAAWYHTPGDTAANLDPASLQHHGANMLGLTRALGEIDLGTVRSDHDAVYFRFLGPVVTYPTALVWPLTLLAAAAVIALVAVARRQRLLGLGRLLVGTVSVLAPLAVAGVLAQALWLALLAIRADYADNPFLYRPLLYQLAVGGLAALAVLAWYLLLRRRIGPAALGAAGLVWLVLLGGLTAWVAPGASHLFTLPALGAAVGWLLAVLLRRRRRVWPALAVIAGTVPAVVLLMTLGVGTLDALGLAEGWIAAVILALFGLTLTPIVELCLPPLDSPLGGRRATAIPLAALLLVLALAGAGLAVDQTDAEHPRRADLLYLLDADTGQAGWVSRDADPGEWTRGYVRDRAAGSEPAVGGVANGPVWTGPAQSIPAPAPEVLLRSRQGDTVTLHISSPRAAPTVLLRLNQPVEQVTAAVPGLPTSAVRVEGSQPGLWPTEIRFGDLPAEGVELTLRVPQSGELAVVALDLTDGLTGVPGFTPRPIGVERSPRRPGDAVVVARTYRF